MSLALRNLIHDGIRLLVSVGGLALSVSLILVLLALTGGLPGQYSAYADHLNADVFVAQRGSTTLLEPSILNEAVQADLLEIEGVQLVSGLYGQPVSLNLEGNIDQAYVIGVDQDSGLGGPWSTLAGKSQVHRGEAILDAALASRLGLRLGDQISVPGRTLKVTGVSAGTNFRYGLIFLERADASFVLGLPDRFNYFLIRAQPGQNAVSLASAINRTIPQVTAEDRATFARASVAPLEQSVLPTMRLMLGVGIFAGTIVIGLIVYAAVLERSREFATVKAIGAGPRQLYAISLQQSLIMAILGFGSGLFLTEILVLATPRIITAVSVRLEPGAVGTGLVITLAMAALAAFLPVRRLIRLDPATAFRA